jgi:prepilin-type N-terminal cleavage/methylation domain-containing protein
MGKEERALKHAMAIGIPGRKWREDRENSPLCVTGSRQARHILVSTTPKNNGTSYFLSSKSLCYLIITCGTYFAKARAGNNNPEPFNMPHRHFSRRQSGFTLIEIAIVLVIIGLLLGGILKGQELINSARVKSLATDFRNIPVFIYGYQDKFRALPGDDSAVVAHVGGTLATTGSTPGNGTIDGAWDSDTTTHESFLFWQHIRLAGLAPGSTNTAASDYEPLNAVGGRVGIQSTKPFTSMNIGTWFICSGAITGKFAKQLDSQLDDGDTDAGSMQAGATANGSGAADGALNDATTYSVCMGV